MLQIKQRRIYLTTKSGPLISFILSFPLEIIINWKPVTQRIIASEMELEDMTGVVVADNTDPVTAIHVRCPRGKAIRRICKVLLEVKKGVLLAFNATNLRVRVGSAEVRRMMNSEQRKEKG